MIDQREKVNELVSFYGPLLTAKQLRILTWYYGEDLSLSEIACNLAISRSAVSDALATARKALDDYEAKLHLHRDYVFRERMYQKLRSLNDQRVTPIVDKLIDKEEESS